MIDFDAQQLADALKGGLTPSTPKETVNSVFDLCSTIASQLSIGWFADTGITTVQLVNIIRGSIVTKIQHGADIATLAAAKGYLLPDNPLVQINQLNAGRRLFAPLGLSDSASDEMVKAVVDLVEVATGFDAGTIKFDRSSPAAQLSSFDMSVDGMSTQTGDPLVDILGYQPDADFVKRKRALDSLAKLDFSKRKPYLLFTADVVTNGRRQSGTIICWMKMRDASGYTIKRRDVFGIVDLPQISLTNESLNGSTADLLADDAFQQVLSFYDWVNRDDIFAFSDDSTHPDTLYSFSVNGVQRRAPATPFIFDVPASSLYLTVSQVELLKQNIAGDISKFGSSAIADSISPYPALAQVVYGDPGYSWILAGCNILAAQRRGETAEHVRSLSYIGSRVDDILNAITAGNIVVPNDVNQIHNAVDNAISSFGVSQTMLSLLDGTGVTMFAAGKDDPLGFKPTQESLESATGGLAKILGAIDPQSATIDPHTLAAALAVKTATTTAPRYESTQIADPSRFGGFGSGFAPGSSVQVLQPLTDESLPIAPSLKSVIGDDLIDLTVYTGIARFMQLIRVIYDFYPGSLT